MKIFISSIVIFLSSLAATVNNSIFSYMVGEIEVHTLVETQSPGNTNILIDPDQADLDLYLPDGTFTSETNTFFVRTPDLNILVDTGFGGALFDSLTALGVEPAQIDAVLLTHLHNDHIGGLQRDGQALFPNAKVYLAQQEKDQLSSPAATALEPYGVRVETFLPSDLTALEQDPSSPSVPDLLSGVKAVAAFGHTRGHTVYVIHSANTNDPQQQQQLVIWGDLMHVELMQFPVPGQAVSYDADRAAAAAVRGRVLAYAAQNGVAIAGMHLVYPAVGTVTKAAAGEGYVFTKATEGRSPEGDKEKGDNGKRCSTSIVVVVVLLSLLL